MEKTIERISMDTEWKEMVSVAKSLGLNAIGKKKEIVVQMVNQKIAEDSKEEKVKWHEIEGACPFQEGDILEVCNREHLAGRHLQMVEVSQREGFIRGYMINPKNGKLLKTLGSHRIDQLKLVLPS